MFIMKNLWNKIKAWLISKITVRNVFYLIVVLFIIGSVSTCSYYKKESDKKDNIIDMQDDSIYTYKNKYGEYYDMSKTYIADKKMLEEYNKELYKELKSLKDNPIIITKIKYEYLIDSIEIVDSVKVVDGLYVSDLRYNQNKLFISGQNSLDIKSMINTTRIDSLMLSLGLTVDLIEKDEQLNILVKSDDPRMNVTHINGAIISPEKSKVLRNYFRKRNSIGVFVGAGVSLGAGFNDGGFGGGGGFGVTVGIGYSYSLFQW